ncbi:MAG TPA: DMT family transporter [Mycobacteriales bacterium]|nr:DMT family transporter [Mycobacteriales bacterium]
MTKGSSPVVVSPGAPHRLLVVLTVLAGALLSVQARVNGALADRLGSATLTALVSFSVGTAAIGVVLATSGRWRAARQLPGPPPLRWWWCCGGFGGAFLVATSAVAVPRVGVALLGVGIVAGQTLGSLAVDEVGLGPQGRQPLTAWRLAGAVIAATALVVAASGRSGDLHLGLLAVVALAGAGVAAQQAANGHLQRRTGEALVAAFVSFAVGTVALAVAAAAVGLVGGLDPSWPGLATGLYLGGLCGAAYITLSASAVGRLGVLRLTLGTVAGQLLGAVALDLLRPAAEGLRASTAVAAALALVAVVVGSRTRPPRDDHGETVRFEAPERSVSP